MAKHADLAKGCKEKNYLLLVKERTTATSPLNRIVQHGNAAKLAAKNQPVFHCLVSGRMELCCEKL